MAPAAEIISIRALSPEGDAAATASSPRPPRRPRALPRRQPQPRDRRPRSAPLRPTDYKSIVDLYETADAAYTAGVVLVASGPNIASFRTYPGRFKSLVGVGRGDFADSEALQREVTDDYEILAPGNDVLAPALGGGERRWTGTSFACPHVAAHPPASARRGPASRSKR